MSSERLPAIPTRAEIVREQKAAGGLVAAVLPIHYPRALLRAFGIHPMEVWGPPRVDATSGAAHLQPYVCSIVRNAVAFLESGGLDQVDIILVPHACDSLQGLASLLLDFVRPRQTVIPLYLPRAAGEEARSFLANELRLLYRRLETASGRTPSEAEMLAAIRREEASDALLARLHANRRSIPLDDSAFYRLVRSREFLPLEPFDRLAQSALALPPAEGRPGIPVVLSGIVPEPLDFLDALSRLGGLIAADDLACSGRRLYPPGVSETPFERLAESMLGGPPDSTRGAEVQGRTEHLKRLTQSSGARGVIFYDVKFCEPELFYLPTLRRKLQSAGIPSLSIEVDLNEAVSNQMTNRLEAFLEMVA